MNGRALPPLIPEEGECPDPPRRGVDEDLQGGVRFGDGGEAEVPVSKSQRRKSDVKVYKEFCDFYARFNMANALANAMCERCKGSFAPAEKIVNSNGELYHEQCFVCAQCFRQFPEGLFYEFEGRKYCEHDFQMLFAPCCHQCGEFIIGRVIKAMNNSWHPHCFCCDICHDVLADVGFVKNAGRHLCRPCHNREKARGMGRYMCQKCHSIIEEQPLLFKNDPYHPDHFSCNNCGKELTSEARELKGELYCLPCHDKMGVPICGACRRPIEGRVVNAMGKQWHVEHFVCAKCEKPFLGHRHYERKGLAYCETHYNQKPIKGFLFAKLYFEAKEYELAKRHVSEYLKVQERDPKAHKFLGQLYEKEGQVDKAVGCYKKDLVLKVAELLCSKEQSDSRVEFWVEKAGKLLPGNPAVFNLKEKLLSRQGQQGWNRLFDLLQAELAVRPADVHVNMKLVELYTKDGRLDEAVKHCLSNETKGQLRKSMDWYSVVVHTLQEYLAQPAVSNNEKLCRRLKGELLLAHSNLLRLKLSVSGVQPALDALRSFDEAMRSVSATAGGPPDELCEVFAEMRAHLYLHTGTLLLKMAHEREQNWRAVTDFAALCFLLSYQMHRPKAKVTKGDQLAPQLLELMASDRQSQAGHMLLNLSSDTQTLITEVVEAFGNRSGQSSLFELLFGDQVSREASFIANDDIGSINAQVPELSQLAKWDNGSIMLHGGDLQHLSWLGLQWTLLAQRPTLRDWLKQLFPRLNLETSKLDTNAPESISLLDLEVFVCGVVFCCHCQLQEMAKISCVGQRPLGEPRCLPLPLLRSLSSDRQREWWDAVYSLIHKQALPGTSAKLRMVVQHGLSTLRTGEKHGLQPSLVISWAQHLSHMGMVVNSYYDQKEYIGRSVHYWKAALPLLGKVKNRRSIPEPLDPLFIHFSNRDIQIYQRLSEEAGSGVEESQDRCIMFLRKFRTYLSKIYNSDDLDQLPVSMEEVMDLLNEVNQQLEEIGVNAEEEDKAGARRAPTLSTPETTANISRVNFTTMSPNKSTVSPSKIHLNEVHDLKHNSSGNLGSPHTMYGDSYGAEGLQEPYTPVQSFPGPQLADAATGPSVYFNQSPAYNSQYLLRPSANVTPTKGAMYNMNRMPPQQHMYSYQQPTHTPPMQPAPPGVYPPQEVFGAPICFDSPATNPLSPYNEEYYSHGVTQPTTNLPLPEPGYFTKPSPVPVQQPKSIEGTEMDFGKISFGQMPPTETPKVPSFVAGPASQSAQSASFKFNSNFKSNDGDFTFPGSQATHSASLLGLLTSDISTKTDFEQKPGAPDQPPSQAGIFTFGSKNVTGFSFAGATQNTGTSGVFEKVEKPFNFGDVTKPIVGMEKPSEGEPLESDNDSTHLEDDYDGPHFEPIVPLPDKIDVKTGEEEEQELFCNRAKLFRFEMETKEWKERGIGNIKILKHNTSGKVRFLMRREQVLKICANHYINVDTLLKPNAGSDKSWVWNAIDYADEQPKPEQLAIRFKTAEEAVLFKTKFEEAKQHVPKSPAKHCLQEKRDVGCKQNETQSFGAQFALKEGEWDCSGCYVRNKSKDIKCIACQTKNPNSLSEPEEKTASDSKPPPGGPSSFSFKFGIDSSVSSSGTPFAGFGAFGSSVPPFSFGTSSSTSADTGTSAFGAQINTKPGQWHCDSCSVRNEFSSNSCVACKAPRTSAASVVPKPSEPEGPSAQMAAAQTTKPLSSVFGSNFGSQFEKKQGQWDCDACYLRNECSSKTCVACQAPQTSAASVVPKPSETEGPPAQMAAAPTTKPLSSVFGSNFGDHFAKKQGQWDCDACYLRNESSSKSCVACQAPQTSAASVVPEPEGPSAQMAAAQTAKPLSSVFGSNFGSQFAKKQGQWDCDACYLRNECSSKTCVACQAPQTSAASVVPKPSEPECPSAQTTKPLSSVFGSSFVDHFAKKHGQWDCDACYLRNESSSKSCVACQAPQTSAASVLPEPEGPSAQMAAAQTAKPLSSVFGSNFGSQFAKKQGQWDCDACYLRNECSSKTCVACQAPQTSAASVVPKPSETEGPPAQMAAAPTTKPLSSVFGSNFGSHFAKKQGQWDCDACYLRNECSSKTCVACQAPQTSAESVVPMPSEVAGPSAQMAAAPTTKPLRSNFGSQFAKKLGQWDCDACYLRNESSSKSCVACQAPQASAVSVVPIPSDTAAAPTSKPLSSAFGSNFGSKFAKKLGQWDCDSCYLRNESSSLSCVACQALNPLSKTPPPTPATTSKPSVFGIQEGKMPQLWDCEKCAVKNEQSVIKCISCQAPYPTLSLGAMFAKKDGEWDCDACMVRNNASVSQCLSCQTPNPNKSTTGLAPSATGLSSSTFSFTFGDKSSPSQSAGTAFTGFANSKGSSFKFGTPQSETTVTSASSFSFALPVQAGGFKFGAQEATKPQTAPVSASTVLKGLADQHKETLSTQSMHGTGQDQNALFTGKPNTLSFAELATSSSGEFGQNDPTFKGFSHVSKQLFSSNQGSPSKVESAAAQEEEDMYKTEENDDIQFEPVVQMPEKVDLVTGEEEEQALYSQRVKLFRFDPGASQWKERGLGVLKFLKNATNGRLRVLMRREQVLKVCANHWITTTMNLKPLAGSDKAWMWLANDFSDGDARLEQLAAKFKTAELALEFKQKFEECQRLLLDIPLQTPHKLVDTGRTAHLIQKAEEMKSGLKDLKCFLTDDRTKRSDESAADLTASSNVIGLTVKPHTEGAGPTLEWDNYDLRGDVLDDSADTSVYASPLASSPVRKNLFRFGESTSGFNFSFQPGISPSKSPAKLNHSGVSVGTDDEQDSTQDEEKDGQYFEPVVPLPDLVDISTGEENEQVVFNHRAKLYRYDKELGQWKERGIGDIKILQNYDTKRVRLIMRRDQVLKICANHWITTAMKLEIMKGSEKAWVWSALDFADVKDGKVEQLAVRFKLQDVANAFKEVFDKAKNAQESETPLTPVTSKVAIPQDTIAVASMTIPPGVCGKAAIAIMEEAIKESTDLISDSQPLADITSSPSHPMKMVVSPPKFVFGTDTLQKIFGTPKSSPEPEDSSSDSRQEDDSHVSQSSASPAFKIPEKGLDFRLFKDNPKAFWTTTSPFKFESPAPTYAEGSCVKTDSDVEVVYVREPSTEQAALAKSLLLPLTFFCYQNEPSYTSEDETDDEDYESAVKSLNGKLYPEPTERGAAAANAGVASDADCQFVWEKKPTPEEEEKAKCLQLPPTFFCELGTSDSEGDKTEEFETEVRKNAQLSTELKASTSAPEKLPSGQLSSTTEAAVSTSAQGEATSDPAPEAQDAIPSSGGAIDLSTRKSEESDSTTLSTRKSEESDSTTLSTRKSEESDSTTLSTRKSEESDSTTLSTRKSEESDSTTLSTRKSEESDSTTLSTRKSEESDSTTLSTKKSEESDSTTLSTKKSEESDSTIAATPSLAFSSATTTSKDSNFSWANAGATVFGVAAKPKNTGDEEGDGEDAAEEVDIHFEPIVSLPEVETKSGEEDEEILFKERTKLFRWDRQLTQWKERGVGDIKILFHPVKGSYRVLMRREQVLLVCANHSITPGMELKPMNSSANALVWTTTDYADGKASVEQLAAKFKNADLADKFQKTFSDCLQRMGQPREDASFQTMSRAQQHSRDTNPRVFLTVAADGETLGTITVELYSHVVPKTAENFRVLCTGERGFGLNNSIFHRIIPNFMCQGGDITNQDGTGGKSIYGGQFEDENFDIRHTGPGLLSMANRGRDTNSSQFYITLKKAEHLDFKHVVFGWVQGGMEVVRLMAELGSPAGKPSKRICILDCGQLT
ncbi:hypothetical protein NHX12_006820 [Muraenolepis orangiensis]|uniref:E3 SUMO-protein ligase RanBP2 n=1 Tax=Muraenolepis orangiensis TaxID=630683 RepID=A0A9Q0IBD3_9TELE|nr:hypothetical protein NHX12_006820 [Muraenolepis orangiensis]